MRRYIIERDLPSIGAADDQAMSQAAKTSNAALAQVPRAQWIESYVAADKTFCVYLAEDEDAIREHARISGFPATRITEIVRIIDPTTAR
jgi:predicted Co/Zn/Cd cation transporter (cation efflux family)